MLTRHGIATALRPYFVNFWSIQRTQDLSMILQELVVYSTPCKDCPMVYIAETGRRFEMRQKEYKRDMKQLERLKNTRTRRKEFLTAIHQLALTDHGMSKNHTID